MKKILLLLLFTILILLSGCNQPSEKFDDNKIQISLLSSQILDHTRTYSVSVKNNGNFTLKHMSMFLSYSKKTTTGTQGNPFKVEARAVSGNQLLMKPSEEMVFNIIAPVGDFFIETNMLDMDKPSVEFRGFYLTSDDEEVPFGMTGNLIGKIETEQSSVSAVADMTKIIAESNIDYDGNGDAEKLYVRMVKGALKDEKEPGPYMGVFWEGEFQLELVAKDGTPLHKLDLNPTFGGGSLLFAQNRALNIVFEDYNNDGYEDFSIGQYFTSNGFTYNLYSLMPEGITVLHRDLYTADSSYSILYNKAGENSFKNHYYDMEKGEMVETLFTWQGDRFVRKECDAAP